MNGTVEGKLVRRPLGVGERRLAGTNASGKRDNGCHGHAYCM